MFIFKLVCNKICQCQIMKFLNFYASIPCLWNIVYFIICLMIFNIDYEQVSSMPSITLDCRNSLKF